MKTKSIPSTLQYESPFGTESIFHAYYEEPKNLSYTSTDDGYIFTIISCKSGSEVFEKYNSLNESEIGKKKSSFLLKTKMKENLIFSVQPAGLKWAVKEKS